MTSWTYPEKFKQMSAYSDAKLLNLIYTYALAAQLDKSTVTVNAADPGQVKTGFGKKAGGFMGLIMKAMGPMLASPAKGALSSVAIATDPELGASTAGYVAAGKLTDSSKSSRSGLKPARSSTAHETEEAVIRTLALALLGLARED
jgi:retinol dehydrogenase-12